MRQARAAIRFTLFLVATLGLYSVWWVVSFFVPNKVYWRQVTFHAWAQVFVRISKMQIEVTGTPPRPPFFLVTNHVSYTDIAAIRAVVTGVFVAKGEVEGWPVAGLIVKNMGTIFIDRQNRRDIPRAGEKIIERLNAGEGVVVFPEGTSTKGETVLEFKSSFLEFAARGGVPVSYAAISYRTPDRELPASTAVCWWEDISFFAHMWRLFTVSGYTAVINFGETPVVNEDRKELAAELREKVAGLFVPIE